MNCKPVSIYENPGLATARNALHVALTVLAISIGVTAARAQTWDCSQSSRELTNLPSAITPPYGSYPFLATAVDSRGDVYLASSSVTQPSSANLLVYEVVAVDGQISSSSQVITVNLNVSETGLAGIAVDSYGNVYVTVPGTTQGTVYQIEATNGQISASSVIATYGSNWKAPVGITVDANGNVFVADYQAGTVEELSWVSYGAFGHLKILESHAVGSGFQNPYGLAFDRSGNLYVSDVGSGTVKKVTPVNGAFSSGSPVTQVGPSLVEPGVLAVDGSGNIIVQTACTRQACPQSFATAMEEIAAVNGSAGPASPAIPIAEDLSSSTGVALEPNGNILVADGVVGLAEITHPAANFGTFAVGQQSQVMMIPYRFGLPGSLTGWKVVTEGAAGLDFQEVQASTTCSTSGTYVAGDTCSVAVQFSPQRPGARAGAVLFDVEGSTTLRDTPMSVIPVPLRGTGIAPQVSFSGGFATVPLWSGLNQPQGIAVDANGNIFFANSGDNSVKEIVAIGGAVSSYSYLVTVGTGFDAPQAIAVDGDGNVYVADSGDGVVYEIPFSNAQAGRSVSPLQISSLGSSPALALDGDGNAFVYAWGGCGFVDCGAVYEFGAPYGQPFGGGGFGLPLTLTTQGSAALAVDANGDLFFASGVTGTVQEIYAVNGRVNGNSTVTTIATDFNQPQGIAVDAAGDLFIANSGDGRIKEVMASSGQVNTSSPVVTIAKGFQQPYGLAFDASGNLYVTDAAANTVTELQLAQTAPVTFPTPTGAGKVDTVDGVRTITIANSGNAPLTFGLTNTGYNPSVSANFAWDNASTCQQTDASSAEAFQLAAGSSCTIAVDFTPVTAGAISGSIVLSDNALNATGTTQSIALSGTGLALPAASLSATSLSFPSTTVGATSNSQSVTMTNSGSTTLTISSIAVTGTNASSFVFANTCGTSLAAGASCTIHGHFAPTSAGALTAAVTITDSASGSPQSIALSGTGVVPVTLSSTSLSFGSITVGGTSGSQTVVMTNTGTAALTITRIAVTGANASQFVFASTCGATLAVGANCTIHGHFAPTTPGAMTASITITDSAGTSPQTIALTGIGVAQKGPVTLSATTLSFGSVAVGASSASQSVTMTNTGTAALTISSIAVTGADASSFVFASTCGTSLAVGASCTIHGHFAPATTGSMTAAITITNSSSGSPQSIKLSGTGQ